MQIIGFLYFPHRLKVLDALRHHRRSVADVPHYLVCIEKHQRPVELGTAALFVERGGIGRVELGLRALVGSAAFEKLPLDLTWDRLQDTRGYWDARVVIFQGLGEIQATTVRRLRGRGPRGHLILVFKVLLRDPMRVEGVFGFERSLQVSSGVNRGGLEAVVVRKTQMRVVLDMH